METSQLASRHYPCITQNPGSRYNTWLLTKLTPKSVVVFSVFSVLCVSFSFYALQSGVWSQLCLIRHPGLKAQVYVVIYYIYLGF